MITSNRNLYQSFHTTPDVLEALIKEVGKRNLAKSRVIHDLVVKALRLEGHDVTGYEFRKTE